MDRLSELIPAGPPLREHQQIGRGGAIDSLEDRLRSCHVVKMLEPRRVGKTSVARAALERIRSAGGSVADVNFAMHPGPERVARDLADQLAGTVSLRTGRRVGGFLSRLRNTDTDGVIGEEAGIALRVAEGIAEELLSGSASPATVLERAAARVRGRATAVLLDEAHTLAAWPETERMALGAVLKDNQAMGVVVASSEQHALKQLTAADGPLRYVGARFELAEIAREDWQVGLQERFAKLGAPVTAGALDLLLDQSRGHPYCTMLLAHESGRLGIDLGGVSEVVVEAALVTVRRDETWQQLR